MVDAHADDIAAGFGNAVANLTFKPREIQSPPDAAMAAMDLMIFAQKTLPQRPFAGLTMRFVRAPTRARRRTRRSVRRFGRTAERRLLEVIAAGAVTLGAMWQAAWRLSGAAEDAEWLTKAFNGEKELMPIYENKESCARSSFPI